MSNQPKKTRFNISEAALAAGKGRSTIQRALKSGTLSSVRGPNGAKLIDASELQRVYGDDCDFSFANSKPSDARNRSGDSQGASHLRLDALEQQVLSLEEERRRERQQLQAQIDHLQDALKLAQEGHNNATRLLENRSSRAGEAASLQTFEQRLNQQQGMIEERLQQLRTDTQQEVLGELRDLPWWAVLRRLAAP